MSHQTPSLKSAPLSNFILSQSCFISSSEETEFTFTIQPISFILLCIHAKPRDFPPSAIRIQLKKREEHHKKNSHSSLTWQRSAVNFDSLHKYNPTSLWKICFILDRKLAVPIPRRQSVPWWWFHRLQGRSNKKHWQNQEVKATSQRLPCIP